VKLAKYLLAGREAVGVVEGDSLRALRTSPHFPTLSAILEAESPAAIARDLIDADSKSLPVGQAQLLAPVDLQEVWAAGVTYRRSQEARMEESEGSASVYDKVYSAERPELFFKATPHRVAGPGAGVRIRRDAHWNVPEPELALALNSRLQLVGFAIGNDMSSRDIEGQNPLYLPQAKCYDACCGLGPWITVGEPRAPLQLGIRLSVRRDGHVVFEGSTSTAQMARSLDELIAWLGRDNSFPDGVFLLTGTGVVPDSDFTLHVADVVEITIDGLGTLVNPIVQG